MPIVGCVRTSCDEGLHLTVCSMSDPLYTSHFFKIPCFTSGIESDFEKCEGVTNTLIYKSIAENFFPPRKPFPPKLNERQPVAIQAMGG
jgi:hypothetical protein